MPKIMPKSIVDRETQEWMAVHAIEPPKMDFRVIMMTPDLAKQMLEGNIHNRRLRKPAVDNMAKAIKRGEWKLTHQAIAVSETGRILDGQHRLSAIANSGTAVPVLVAYNADERTFDAFDTGIKRTVQDIIQGERQVLQVSTVLCRMFYTENDNSIQRVEEMHERIGPLAEKICHGVTKLNRINVAGIRAGVILRATLGDQRYITDLWRELVNQMTESLPPIGHAFLRRMNQPPKRHGAHRPELENLCMGWEVANPRRREQSRFALPPVPSTIAEMRGVLKDFMGSTYVAPDEAHETGSDLFAEPPPLLVEAESA